MKKKYKKLLLFLVVLIVCFGGMAALLLIFLRSGQSYTYGIQDRLLVGYLNYKMGAWSACTSDDDCEEMKAGCDDYTVNKQYIHIVKELDKVHQHYRDASGWVVNCDPIDLMRIYKPMCVGTDQKYCQMVEQK